MSRRLILLFSFILLSVTSANAIERLDFQCTYTETSSCSAGVPLFTAAGNLSANIMTSLYSSGPSFSNSYTHKICCEAGSDTDDVSFTVKEKANEDDYPCYTPDSGFEEGTNEVMYFTDSINARVSREYDSDYHNATLCANFAKPGGIMHILWNDQDYTPQGYECLFKTNDVENGHVSSCDAKFDTTGRYDYTVWGLLLDDIDSLNCKTDCSSKLDNRIYSICKVKVPTCRDVPLECDGSLKGAWVKYERPDTGESVEVQCSAPWNNYRSRVFSNESISVTTEVNSCDNLIKIEYPVLLNNEQVVMNLYMCDEEY